MPRTEEKKKIKLIASDLDGTLLQHSARNCNEELFPIIEQLCEKGVYFIPASGRQYPCMQNMFAPVKDKIMYKGEELDILSVVSTIVVGDYGLQWKIQAKGKNLPYSDLDNTNNKVQETPPIVEEESQQ